MKFEEPSKLRIKGTKRFGFGFRNFANCRLRLLLHSGTTGTLTQPHGSEAGHHVQCRRASLFSVECICPPRTTALNNSYSRIWVRAGRCS